MRPVDNLIDGLNRRAFIVAGLSTAATTLPKETFAHGVSAKALSRTNQWPETDASLAYIKKIGPEIERKTGMAFVAMDSTKFMNPPVDGSPDWIFVYGKGSDPLSPGYKTWLANYVSNSLRESAAGQELANLKVMDKIYLLTVPKTNLKDNISFLAPQLQSSSQDKNFSLDKFLSPLTADDLIAFENYHELRHVFQSGAKLPEDSLLNNSLSPKSLKQALEDDNGCEAEADSFAALKFTSGTDSRTDSLRRIEAVKIIAKLRLQGDMTNPSASEPHDTYDTLTQTIKLMENAHHRKWDAVQAQFSEMYQRVYSDQSLAWIQQMARADTNRIRGSGGIDKLSDDQYLNLSSFMAETYAPNVDQLLAVITNRLQKSSDADDQTDLNILKQKFGAATAEGQAYLVSHLQLANEGLRSGMVAALVPSQDPASSATAPKSRIVRPIM